jgi:hypothetical protein
MSENIPSTAGMDLYAMVDYESVRDLIGSSITMNVLATVFVGMRVSIKRSRGRRLELDDWFVIASLVWCPR